MEVRGYPRWQRIYAACIFAAGAIFFLWLYWNNRASAGSGIGLAIAAVCFWQAVYWVRLPKVLAVLQPDGMDYINQDLAMLFWYRWFHIDWNRITDIQTHEQSDRSGPFLVTVLRAGVADRPGKIRSFRITSRNMDYYRFLEYLKAVTEPAKLKQGGLPLEPAQLRQTLRRDQWRKLAGLYLTVLALIIVAYFIRR